MMILAIRLLVGFVGLVLVLWLVRWVLGITALDERIGELEDRLEELEDRDDEEEFPAAEGRGGIASELDDALTS